MVVSVYSHLITEYLWEFVEFMGELVGGGDGELF